MSTHSTPIRTKYNPQTLQPSEQTDAAIALWRHTFGDLRGMLQIFTAPRDADGRRDRRMIRAQFYRYPEQAQEAAQWTAERSAEGRCVFFAAHLLKGRRRGKEYASKIRWLWADLDGCQVPEGNLAPSSVVESSPNRYHIGWRLEKAVEPKVAERLNIRLAAAIGADPSGADLSQLLRIPGTRNAKYPEQPVVDLLRLEDRTYSAEDLEALLPPEQVVEQAARPPVVAGMRLVRGDEEIIDLLHKAKNSQKFEALFDHGDLEVHDGDHSRADLALARMVTFYSNDEAQIERIMGQSALARREKWQQRADYRERTIQTAIMSAQGGPTYSSKKSSGGDPGAREILDRAGDYWYSHMLPRSGKSKRRDVFRSLLLWASKVGTLVTTRVDGQRRRAVRVEASYRQIALEAATTPASAFRGIDWLRIAGAIRSNGASRDAKRGESTVFLIIEPAHAHRCNTQINTGGRGTTLVSIEGVPLVRVPRPEYLKAPAPRWSGPISNAQAALLFALEAYGPATTEVLADRLGYSRPRDMARRLLRGTRRGRGQDQPWGKNDKMGLVDLGLVMERTDGVFALSPQYEKRLGEIQDLRYSTIRRMRKRQRNPEGRTVTTVVEVGLMASMHERHRIDEEKYRIAREAYVNRCREEAGRAPSLEEMRRRREERVQAREPETLQLSDLARAINDYLTKSPGDADQRPSWIANTLWALDLYPGKPTPPDVRAAIDELGGAAYPDGLLKRAGRAS